MSRASINTTGVWGRSAGGRGMLAAPGGCCCGCSTNVPPCCCTNPQTCPELCNPTPPADPCGCHSPGLPLAAPGTPRWMSWGFSFSAMIRLVGACPPAPTVVVLEHNGAASNGGVAAATGGGCRIQKPSATNFFASTATTIQRCNASPTPGSMSGSISIAETGDRLQINLTAPGFGSGAGCTVNAGGGTTCTNITGPGTSLVASVVAVQNVGASIVGGTVMVEFTDDGSSSGFIQNNTATGTIRSGPWFTCPTDEDAPL